MVARDAKDALMLVTAVPLLAETRIKLVVLTTAAFDVSLVLLLGERSRIVVIQAALEASWLSIVRLDSDETVYFWFLC